MSDDLLHDLGKELPFDRPDAERRDAVRASLLAAATRRQDAKPQRWRVIAAFGLGAVAAAAVAMIYVRQHAPVTAAAATLERAYIESSAGAELEHTLAATPTGMSEVVRVHAGKLRVSLAPVGAGDRVAIETGNARVEGAGAVDVQVTDDRLASVTVATGAAKIVVGDAKAVFLAAGETWRAEIVRAEVDLPKAITSKDSPTAAIVAPSTSTATKPTASVPPVIATRAPVGVTHASTEAQHAVATHAPSTVESPPPQPAVTALAAPKSELPVETEQHFQRGWKLLRANKPVEAAVELGRAADGDGPIAVDARYFQGEALVKAGRKTEAEKALLGFLDHAPTSARRGRAAVMLARLIAERGDSATARNWYQAALKDSDANVVAAANAGLSQL